MKTKTAVRDAARRLASTAAHAVEKAEVIDTYADIAQAGYEDSALTARRLLAAVDALIANPSAETWPPPIRLALRPACPISRPSVPLGNASWMSGSK